MKSSVNHPAATPEQKRNRVLPAEAMTSEFAPFAGDFRQRRKLSPLHQGGKLTRNLSNVGSVNEISLRMYSDNNGGRNNLSDQVSQASDRPRSPHGAPFQRFISNDLGHVKDKESRHSQESHSIQAIDAKINNLMNNNKAKVFGSQNKLINKLKQLNQR